MKKDNKGYNCNLCGAWFCGGRVGGKCGYDNCNGRLVKAEKKYAPMNAHVAEPFRTILNQTGGMTNGR